MYRFINMQEGTVLAHGMAGIQTQEIWLQNPGIAVTVVSGLSGQEEDFNTDLLD